jgi:hypothetical protein
MKSSPHQGSIQKNNFIIYKHNIDIFFKPDGEQSAITGLYDGRMSHTIAAHRP